MNFVKTFELHSIFSDSSFDREIVSWNDWTVDPNTYVIKYCGKSYKNFPYLVFVLIHFLVKQCDKFTHPYDIHDFIYGEKEGRINMLFVKARQLIGEDIIEYEKGKGYRIKQ